MQVRACRRMRNPGYPSRTQFSAGRALVGAAAIGLGAVVGRGEDPVRLRGEIVAEPSSTPPASSQPVQPVMVKGVMPLAPRTGAATNAPPPAASTNTTNATSPTPQLPGGIRAAAPAPLLGVMRAPVETK